MRLPFLYFLLPLLVILVLPSRAFSQDTLISPVFKNYRHPKPAAIIERSDATYQMWQTFQLTQKANSGDFLAQYELGVRYLIGRGLTADSTKGAYWTRKAADQGLASARFNLGILLEHGWGVEWNPFEAYSQFALAAERGMPEAQFAMGHLLTDNLVVPRNWEDAYQWIRAAADSGYEPAKDALPEFLKRGYGDDSTTPYTATTTPTRSGQQWAPILIDFASDTTKKVDDKMLLSALLREATPAMQKALGTATPDTSLNLDSAALQSVQRAANAGSPEALTVLGRCYEKGVGMKKDPVRAVSNYIRAVRFDGPHAFDLLWTLLEQQQVVAELRVRAAQNQEEAMFCLATLASLGLQYPLLKGHAWVTEAQALELLTLAARRGHIASKIELGLCYFSGRWVNQNRERAFDLWTEAGDMGSIEAEVRLAASMIMSETGNPDSVTHKLDKGIEEGSVLAQVALGYCYERGFGMMKSKGEAARYYRNAATRGSQDAYRALIRIHDEIRPQEARFRIEG
ncbi:MAG: tetratricopeptide repeat protein [Bacteroidota bacterium]